MKLDLNKISKFLSYVLRHKPEAIGIQLSAEGWIGVEELITAASKDGNNLSRTLLDEVVFTNDKQRFAYSADGLSIRANQGHSVDIELALKPTVPPDTLYHGTATRFIESIKEQGLIKKQRQHVHLSALYETAVSVGQRHGKPVVLSINAKQMNDDGHLFYLSKNSVWLTDFVAVEYIGN
ncbi:MAG: RNA 2'-phosphotransferase [Alcanivoracaceae bacterium]|nr:RNA 2'-phosphotransferase [Alcanivoracaceae bacterium]